MLAPSAAQFSASTTTRLKINGARVAQAGQARRQPVDGPRPDDIPDEENAHRSQCGARAGARAGGGD